ncbi:AroB-related putative sugar phosphate phospholyase (cyclizing) [Halarcobacter sp.]|uniref:AroB-related putative sugar phosphate phospholyase (cyclizing) n=1 Tax=Halarcobacter sp. TaxID=2321133 RepID=UPI002AA7D624|nr:AroB-related putative sugar phosphate phospholyase (cyclizing) [Halarcobacter sp.]
MKKLILNSNIHNYEVKFKNDLEFINKLIDIKKKVFIIDKNIYNLYKQYFTKIQENRLYIFDAIEEKKTLESVQNMYKFLAKFDEKRNITLISIGGGITQDVTGFVASTLYRGIHWIFIPTTFLAQADSSIGSKTSLNFETYKNILGGFYPPNTIYIAPIFLKTLTKKDFFSGIGEVIKFALLEESYPKKIDSIIKTIEDLKNDKNILKTIFNTMKIKKAYIDEDEFDIGKRNLFNYGHCFGHALENSSSYKIPHGIAVTIGMIFANIISFNRGLISKNIFNKLNKKLFLPNIPIKLKDTYFNPKVLLESMKNDKKRIGKDLTIIIPIDNDIRATKIDNLTFEEFNKTLDELIKILGLK